MKKYEVPQLELMEDLFLEDVILASTTMGETNSPGYVNQTFPEIYD